MAVKRPLPRIKTYSAIGRNALIHLVLFQPDIPQNVGAVLRLGACFALPVDIIEPCGFVWDDKRLRRAGMDYTDKASLVRHRSWTDFQTQRTAQGGRLLLFTTKTAKPYHDFSYAPGDHLIFGRESAGVPEDVFQAADERVTIPMAADTRSLNLAQSAAIAAAEALRQLDHWPKPGHLPPTT